VASDFAYEPGKVYANYHQIASRRLVLAGCGKSRVCHPEPALFAGEGSAVRKTAKEKADSSPVKNQTGFGMTYFYFFRRLLGFWEQYYSARHRADFG
jgi:hypothetical protein